MHNLQPDRLNMEKMLVLVLTVYVLFSVEVFAYPAVDSKAVGYDDTGNRDAIMQQRYET